MAGIEKQNRMDFTYFLFFRRWAIRTADISRRVEQVRIVVEQPGNEEEEETAKQEGGEMVKRTTSPLSSVFTPSALEGFPSV